ncbi:MAG TPA: DUF4159 domain-containing protein, partial [Tepidisphaeraceae bacterium]|nr:DUF4159 domain-containing protein [Tepidisphaeraceae bacterium]
MAIKVRCPQCAKLATFGDSDAGLTALCVACGGRFTIPAVSTATDAPGDAGAPQSAPAVGPGFLAAGGDFTLPALPHTQAVAGVAQAPVVPAGAPELPAATQTARAGSLFPPAMSTVAALGGAGSPLLGESDSTGVGVVPQPAVAPGQTLVPGASRAVVAPPPPLAAHRSAHRKLAWGLSVAAVVMVGVLVAVMVAALQPSWEQERGPAIRALKEQADRLVIDNRPAGAHDAYKQIADMTAGRTIRDPGLRTVVEKAKTAQDELFAVLMEQAKARALASAAATTKVAPPPPPTMPAPIPSVQASLQAGRGAAWGIEAATAAVKAQPAAPVESPKPAIAIRPPSDRVAPAKRPEFARRGGRGGGDVTDEEIGRSIQRAVDFLLANFRGGLLHGGPDGGGKGEAHYAGTDALCVYALLQASYAIKDERLNPKGPLMKEMIAKMKDLPMERGPVVYARGIRSTALALLNRPEDKEALKADVMYLVNGHSNGGYTYVAQARTSGPGGRWDNSNSQYGLLGAWSGAEAGIEINSSYWMAVDGHWSREQNDNGTWDYSDRRGGGTGRLSMTLAGIASLYVTHDALDAPKYGTTVGRDPFSPGLKKGLDYLEKGDNAMHVDGGYSLYGLERVGLASGFKFFGEHDWYRELARRVVDSQKGGAWNGSYGVEVNTAYHLLFLARGRHPILMNKLRFDGPWANRPRDVANLARLGAKELERQLNWQVVPITRDWTDWTDSPILYVSSHLPLKFTDEQVTKVRKFVQAGGLLYTQADGSGIPATRSFEDLAKKLFPDYEMQDLPDDHEIYSIHFKPSPRPRLRYVTNGVRVLMVHSSADLSQHWQLRQEKTKRNLYEFGMNLFLYASGKADLKNRLASPVIPAQAAPGGGRLKVARVKYAGA